MITVTVSILRNVPGASSAQHDITEGAAANLAAAIRRHAEGLSVGMTTPDIETAYRAFYAIAAALDGQQD